MTINAFRALVVEEVNETIQASVKEINLEDLSAGETLIKTSYSGINYKDALATIKNGGVIRSYPMIPGVDAVGEIIETTAPNFKKGDKVVITGNGLGVSHTGGFSEVIRVPNEWVIALPETVSEKEAATIGTAGITAIESINELEKNKIIGFSFPANSLRCLIISLKLSFTLPALIVAASVVLESSLCPITLTALLPEG